MFKKAFTVSQGHKLSGSDRKKIRRALQARFPCLEEDASALDELVPVKSGDVAQTKLAAPSKAMLLSLDGQPMFLDMSGKGDYMPTVFALWRCPGLLPTVYLMHPAVSKFVLGGADLMLPGVAPPVPPLREGALCSISVEGNPAPIAVGQAVISGADAAARIAAGGKGRLLQMLHHFKDMLWASAASAGGAAVPNDGFHDDVVLPIGIDTLQAAEVAGEGQEGGWEESGGEVEQEPEAGAESAAAAEAAQGAADAAGLQGGCTEQENCAAAAQGQQRDEAGAAAAPAVVDAGSPEAMDELLLACFLQALHKSVPDKALPMASSTLWASHILPSRPPDSHLDLKKSSYKKLSKFLAAHGKNGSQLLLLKEDKRQKELILQRVCRDHPLYQSFQPFSDAPAPAAAPALAAGSGAAAATAAAASREGLLDQPLLMQERFKPAKELHKIFAAAGVNAAQLFTAEEAAQVPLQYVEKEQLQETAEGGIVLDPHLTAALYKGVLKKEERLPTAITRQELRGAFMKRMLPQWQLVRGGYEAQRKGAMPLVHVGVAKRGSKRVTCVQGVEAFLVDPAALASACQKRFACSCSVAELEGRKGGLEVVVQGSVAEGVGQLLTDTCGIPKRYVDVVVEKGSKKH